MIQIYKCKKCNHKLRIGRALTENEKKALAILGFYGTHTVECRYCKE